MSDCQKCHHQDLLTLKEKLKRTINRPSGRWGIHGESCVDDDYFLALENVVIIIEDMVNGRTGIGDLD